MAEMAEDQDFVIHLYYSAIDTFERAESLFHRLPRAPNRIILEELRNCTCKVDEIMAMETDSGAHFVSLFQLKKHIDVLIEIVETRVGNEVHNIFARNNVGNLELHANKEECSLSEPPLTKKIKIAEEDEIPQDIKHTIQIPKVSGLKEIVGLPGIKKTLKSLVILPKTQPQLFHNRKMCNSILLFGPPGTGKTRLVHALAAEARSALYCISASDVLSHYVGQTEKALKGIFEHLKEIKTFSILFIDEIDGFCRKRCQSEPEYTRRIKTELMCQLSNTENCKNLFIICATNCPWDLDSAILRRFHKRIYVPLPNHLERLQLFQFFMQNEHFNNNIENWSPLVRKTEGYSGSDISDVVQNALNIPLDELEDTKIWKQRDDGYFEPVLDEQDFANVICSELCDLPLNSVKSRRIHMTDFIQACENVKFTVNKEDLIRFEEFNGRS